jgi:LPXTG-motif cell wall-anchored protein
MPDECVSLNWAWSYVQGSLAQGRRGIYAEMIHGLMRLKQQLRIPGAYDWPAVTERLRTEYGVRLIPMDGYTFMGDSWAWAQGWSLVNAAGQVCTGGTCFWRAPKPEGLGNVIWRDIPRNQQVAPPMLADGYTIEDNRVVLQQGYRLCSNIPADWNRVTAANCIYCRENAEEWLSSFLAAVTAETAWLYTIAELQRALTQAQYEQGVALQTAYVEGAAAYQAATTEYEANREARHTAYLLLLIEFLGLTPAAQGQTRSAVDLMIQDALQERGLSAQTVLSWISYCEPPYPPTWDPVECFRAGIERWRVEYPSRGLSAQDVFNLQLLLNPILQLLGYQPIAENGVLDGRVCGAVELVNAGVDRLEHSEHAARWHAAWSYAGGIVTEACAEVPTPWEAPLTQPGVVPLVSPRVALGPKARAQIAIVALGLAALGGAAWWFLRKRRR